MHRFVKHIIIFTVATLLGLIAIEYAARHSKKMDYVHYKAERLKQCGDTIETIFLGTSLTYQGMDPAYWADGHAFNLGSNAANKEMQYYLVKAVLPQLPNLKSVSIEISTYSFYSDELENGSMWFFWIPYTMYYKTDKHSQFSRYAFELTYPPDLRKRILPWQGSEVLDCDGNGHCVTLTLAARLSDWNSIPKGTHVAHEALQPKLIQQNVKYFTEILDMCKARGIEVFVRIMPLHPKRAELLDKVQLQRTYQILYSLKAIYHFRVLNYLTDSRLVDDDMDDLSHLNTDVGAPKWTKIIYDDYKRGRDDAVMPIVVQKEPIIK